MKQLELIQENQDSTIFAVCITLYWNERVYLGETRVEARMPKELPAKLGSTSPHCAPLFLPDHPNIRSRTVVLSSKKIPEPKRV
jgi:hypothetical protein